MATQITDRIFFESREWVLKRFGQERWSQVLGILGQQNRSLFQTRKPGSGWVHFVDAVELLGAIEQGLASEGSSVMHELGVHNAEANLRVTQKMIMKILTVKMVLRLASFLWTGRVLDGGRMVVANTGPRSVRCRIEQPPDVSELWWRYLAGWFQRTIELAGGRAVDSRFVGGGEQPRQTAEFEVSWS